MSGIFQDLLIAPHQFSFQRAEAEYNNKYYMVAKEGNKWKLYLTIPNTSIKITFTNSISLTNFLTIQKHQAQQLIKEVSSQEFTTLRQACEYAENKLKKLIKASSFNPTTKFAYDDLWYAFNPFYNIKRGDSPIYFFREKDSSWGISSTYSKQIGKERFLSRPQGIRSLHEYVSHNLYSLYSADKQLFQYYKQVFLGEIIEDYFDEERFDFWWILFLKPQTDLQQIFK